MRPKPKRWSAKNLLTQSVHVPLHQKSRRFQFPTLGGFLQTNSVLPTLQRFDSHIDRSQTVGPAQFLRPLIHEGSLPQKGAHDPSAMGRRRLVGTQIQGHGGGQGIVFKEFLEPGPDFFDGNRHQPLTFPPLPKLTLGPRTTQRLVNKPKLNQTLCGQSPCNPFPITKMRSQQNHGTMVGRSLAKNLGIL